MPAFIKKKYRWNTFYAVTLCDRTIGIVHRGPIQIPACQIAIYLFGGA
jgi:hypothetical protein